MDLETRLRILALLAEILDPAHAPATSETKTLAPAGSPPSEAAAEPSGYTPEEQALIEQRLADLGYL